MSIPIPHRQLFVDGEWREPVNRKRIPITNPATEEIIGDIPAATVEDVNVAVEAARKALSRNGGKDWASATGAHRAKYLRAIAAKITERKSELATLEALDCGKPLDEAAWDIDDVAGCFEYYAEIAEGLDKKQKTPVPLPMETFKCHVLREPIGVVGLITPWNYPMLMATWKVAPALAAGCTAILKPSELASVTCLELADVGPEVGLHRGVLNVLTGWGPDAGTPLASHPHVDKIAFTGSNATGRKIMTAAEQLVQHQQDLGGAAAVEGFMSEEKQLERVIWSFICSEGYSEARLWLCITVSGINSISPRHQRDLFMSLLRSKPIKWHLASQLLQLIFEKQPRKMGPIIAKKSCKLENFFKDHGKGAKALSQFAFVNRDICWEELQWKGKHGLSPAMVAAKPHYFLDLDVQRTVENFIVYVPEFWSSHEFSEL